MPRKPATIGPSIAAAESSLPAFHSQVAPPFKEAPRCSIVSVRRHGTIDHLLQAANDLPRVQSWLGERVERDLVELFWKVFGMTSLPVLFISGWIGRGASAHFRVPRPIVAFVSPAGLPEELQEFRRQTGSLRKA